MEVLKKTLKSYIPVDFRFTKNVKQGLKAYLETRIFKWDTQIQGIIKTYGKIRILDKKCRISEDSGVILVYAQYTVYYFKPNIGGKLEGIIKNWNSSQIGGLVDNFNAVITCSNGSFENGTWKDINLSEIKKDLKVAFVLEK